MSEDILSQAADSEAPAVPGVGARLRSARESQGMSLEDAAQTLKLGLRQVEALERGDWGSLPGPTFIRGFVRNYARLLQLDHAPLMGELDVTLEPPQASLDLPAATPAAMPAANSGRRRDYAVALFGMVLVAVALAVYFLPSAEIANFRESIREAVSPTPNEEAAALPPAQPEPLMPPGATPREVLNPQAAVPAEPAAPASEPVLQAPQSAPAPAAAAQPGAVPSLRFALDRESWIEVRDGSGNVIFSQKSTGGSEQVVDGKGPFAVVVGNAQGVRLYLRGQPVDLTPHTRGDVARLILD